jgi:hypothetical protein
VEWGGCELGNGIRRGIRYCCAIGLLIGGLPACSTTQFAEKTEPVATGTTSVNPAEAERPARETQKASKSSERTSKSGSKTAKSQAGAKEKESEKATAKSDAPIRQPEAGSQVAKRADVPLPDTPGGGTAASSDGVKGLYVAEAAFADDVVDGVPKGRFKDVVRQSQVYGQLWFWMKGRCEDACLGLMKSKPGGLPVSVTWLPPGAGKGWTNKTRITGDGFRLAFHTTNILLGRWKVRVESEGGAVCTRTRECEFAIEVK